MPRSWKIALNGVRSSADTNASKQVHRTLLTGLPVSSKSLWLRISSGRSRDRASRASLEGPGWAAAVAAQVMRDEVCIFGRQKTSVLRRKGFWFAQLREAVERAGCKITGEQPEELGAGTQRIHPKAVPDL